MRKPLLLGLDNPHSDDPRAALLPRPAGSAGWRLFKLSKMTWSQYRRAFDRANVVDVVDQSDVWRDRTVLVMGREAWRVLQLPVGKSRLFDRFFTPDGRTKFILIPHPSGRNHFYNTSQNRHRVTRLLRRLADEQRSDEDAE